MNGGLLSEPSATNPHTFVIKTLHPAVSYFDYLPVFGLWGEVAKYLIEDDRAFGQHSAYLDDYLKTKLAGGDNVNDDEYKGVLRQTLRDYRPLFGALQKMTDLSPLVFDVKSKLTGKTFGEALTALANIQNNADASAEFVNRLNEYDRTVEPKDTVHISLTKEFLGPNMFEHAKQLTEKVLERPLEFKIDVSNPSQFARLPMAAMKMFTTINFDSAILLARQWIVLFNDVYNDYVTDGLDVLDQLYDPDTKLSIGKSLRAIANGLNQPANMRKLSALLNSIRRDILTQPKKYVAKALEITRRLGIRCPYVENLAVQFKIIPAAAANATTGGGRPGMAAKVPLRTVNIKTRFFYNHSRLPKR